MPEQRINISDRKIVNVQSGPLRGSEFRLPGVNIVGYGADVRDVGGEPPGTAPGDPVFSGELGTPSDIQVENMEVRIQPDGSALVDVTFSYTPADGAATHEMRISRL